MNCIFDNSELLDDYPYLQCKLNLDHVFISTKTLSDLNLNKDIIIKDDYRMKVNFADRKGICPECNLRPREKGNSYCKECQVVYRKNYYERIVMER